MPRLSSRSLFMSLYLFIAVAALAPHVFAVPLSRPLEILPLAPRDSDDSIAVEKSWVSEPTTRGSIGLLWSCTLTIMLAVWSTLHLNVQMAADATLDDALDESSANDTLDDALDELSANATPDDESSANATVDDQSSANATVGDESSANGTFDDALDNSSAKASTTPSRLRWLRRQLSPNHRVGWKYKFFWALLTLLVPELPLAVSLGELWLSRDLLREVKKEAPEAFMKWDLTMAFYVVMGGFYVHLDNLGPHSLRDRVTWVNRRRLQKAPDNKTETIVTETEIPEETINQGREPDNKIRDVLTPHGFLYIARLLNELKKEDDKTEAKKKEDKAEYNRLKNQINDMNSAILQDLSKTNTVAKLIVFLQAAWIIVQVIGRFLSHFPVTILELHTAAHSVCAIIMYATWWHKPMDIFIATPLSLNETQYKKMLAESTPDTINHLRVQDYAREFLRGNTPQDASGDSADVHTNSGLCSCISHYWWSLLLLSETEDENTFYLSSQGTLAKELYKMMVGRVKFFDHVLKGIVQALVHIVFSWSRWPGKAILWVLTALFYSTCHLVSWNWHFPTDVEARLWRVCTGYTAGSMLALGILAVIASMYVFYFEHRNRTPLAEWGKIETISDKIRFLIDEGIRHGLRIAGLALTVGIPFWLLARVFMVVEAYLSTRSLKEGSFKTIQWAEIIPHLG